MFNKYFYSVFTRSDFVLPNMEELVKPTIVISDNPSHPAWKKSIKYLVHCRIKRLVVLMALDLQFFKLVPPYILTPVLHHLFSLTE